MCKIYLQSTVWRTGMKCPSRSDVKRLVHGSIIQFVPLSFAASTTVLLLFLSENDKNVSVGYSLLCSEFSHTVMHHWLTSLGHGRAFWQYFVWQTLLRCGFQGWGTCPCGIPLYNLQRYCRFRKWRECTNAFFLNDHAGNRLLFCRCTQHSNKPWWHVQKLLMRTIPKILHSWQFTK